MKQKMLIEVNADKPLSEYGTTYVLLYDGIKKQYFAKSRDEIFSAQNAKIKQLETIIEQLKIEVKEYQDQLTELNKAFQEGMEQRFTAFLESYRETNAEVIRMVKSVVEEK